MNNMNLLSLICYGQEKPHLLQPIAMFRIMIDSCSEFAKSSNQSFLVRIFIRQKYCWGRSLCPDVGAHHLPSCGAVNTDTTNKIFFNLYNMYIIYNKIGKRYE